MQSLLGVVRGQWFGLCVIGFQALDQSGRVVVASSHQRFAGYVVGHRHFGRRKFIVIRSAAGLVNHATGNSTHQQAVVNAELNYGVQILMAFLQQSVELSVSDNRWHYT